MNPQAQPPTSSNPTNNPASAAPPPVPATPPPSPVSAATGAWPGGLEAIKQAFAGIMANPVPAAIYIGASLVGGLLLSLGHYGSGNAARAGYSGGGSLVSLLFIRAMVLYGLSIADKKPLSVSQFFAVNLKQFFYLILAVIAVCVILLISAIPILIPWIWVIPWLAVTTYALVDKDLSPFAAIGESRRLASHQKGKVWGLIGWFVLVGIVAAIVGVIPYVSYLVQPALVVLEGATLAILYRHLQAQPQPQQPSQPAQPTTPPVAAA